MKTWREIFDAEKEFKNVLKLVELCFVIPVSNAIVESFFRENDKKKIFDE